MARPFNIHPLHDKDPDPMLSNMSESEDECKSSRSALNSPKSKNLFSWKKLTPSWLRIKGRSESCNVNANRLTIRRIRQPSKTSTSCLLCFCPWVLLCPVIELYE